MPSIAGDVIPDFGAQRADIGAEEQPSLSNALESLHEGKCYVPSACVRAMAELILHCSITDSCKAASCESIWGDRYHLPARVCRWS